MAGSKFQYDESGGTFFYFLLSFLALVVIPCTYYFWPKDKNRKEPKEERNVGTCHCYPCIVKANNLEAKKPWQKTKERFVKFILILGWLALFATAYKAANIQHDYVAWDPFEILEIDPGSSTTEIKKAYRRLSLIYHPDKETGDEAKFLQITKAHAALTDDEARKNWEMYGNPDGPGVTSFGIALPSWIVDKDNSILVLGVYALVFMVALPTAVGIWWYRSLKYSGDRVLVRTTKIFCHFIIRSPHMILRRVLMVLAAAEEFELESNNGVIDRPEDIEEIKKIGKSLPNIGDKNRESHLSQFYSMKARILLYAHMARMKLPPNTLELDKNQIVRKCPMLLQEFVAVITELTSVARISGYGTTPHIETCENAINLCGLIVQAMFEVKSPFLQLPHITAESRRYFHHRRRIIKTIHELAEMRPDDRRSMLRFLSDEQYEDLMVVLGNMPLLSIDWKSEVLDDEDSMTITASAVVTVTVKLSRKSMSTLFIEETANSNQMASIDGEDGDQLDENQENRGDAKKSAPVWKNKAKKKKKKKPVLKAKKGQNNPTDKKSTNKTSDSKNTEEADDENEDDDVDNESVDESKQESENEKKPENEKSDADLDDDEWYKLKQKMSKRDKVLEAKSKRSHSVHCPYFPDDKQEYWYVYISDKQKMTLITKPTLVTNLVEYEEVEIQFDAPRKPGIYHYLINVLSDSYYGFDRVKNIKFDVKEAKEVIDHPQWDISEEENNMTVEEDSAVEDSDLVASDDDVEEEDFSD